MQFFKFHITQSFFVCFVTDTTDSNTDRLTGKLKKHKISKTSSVIVAEEERDISQMLHRLKLTGPSSLTEEKIDHNVYGTSRTSRRKLPPRPRLQIDSYSEPNLEVEERSLPKFEHKIDPSGKNAYTAFIDHYSKVRRPPPEVGCDTYALYENTVSHVPGGVYQDHEGNYYQLPGHPSLSIKDYGFDHLHESDGVGPQIKPSSEHQDFQNQQLHNVGHDHSHSSYGVISTSGTSSDPAFTQSYGHNHLLQFHGVSSASGPVSHPPSTPNYGSDNFHSSYGVIPPLGPSYEHHGFQHHQLHMNDPTWSQGINLHNDDLRNKYLSQYGDSGSGHGSSYPYQ